jgi:hypothetical protein
MGNPFWFRKNKLWCTLEDVTIITNYRKCLPFRSTWSMSSPPDFSGVPRSLVLCVMFCRSLFVLLAIVLSFLWFKDSDYPFGIFKLFLLHQRCTFVHVQWKKPLLANSPKVRREKIWRVHLCKNSTIWRPHIVKRVRLFCSRPCQPTWFRKIFDLTIKDVKKSFKTVDRTSSAMFHVRHIDFSYW